MKQVSELTSSDISDDYMSLLLEEAERALIQIDSRPDDPGARASNGDASGSHGEDVAELRLAMAELVDAYPSLPHDLELISERLRSLGPNGSDALESHSHVIDLVRISLEIFFRLHPTLEAYETDCQQRRESLDLATSAMEFYETSKQMLWVLRLRIS